MWDHPESIKGQVLLTKKNREFIIFMYYEVVKFNSIFQKVLEDYVKNEPFTLDQSVLTRKLEGIKFIIFNFF